MIFQMEFSIYFVVSWLYSAGVYHNSSFHTQSHLNHYCSYKQCFPSCYPPIPDTGKLLLPPCNLEIASETLGNKVAV